MEVSEFFKGLFSKSGVSQKQAKWLTVLGVAGMLLIMLTGLWPDNKGKADVSQDVVGSLDVHAQQTEQRLAEILKQIKGVGAVHVMVTLENGVEYRYAADEKQSGDSVFTYADGSDAPSKVQEKEDREQSYILVDSSGGKKPLVLTELSPRVKGVVVVCSGAGNPVIRQRVTDAVTTALGVTSLQVCVIQSAE
ncbi:MAG: hypothetical protein K0S22_2534 [Oscillospiraceae bacterium]|jgi:stage III sporulation protein AG|nr:hypothetical protein [Oscillospiraceae bacterium]